MTRSTTSRPRRIEARRLAIRRPAHALARDVADRHLGLLLDGETTVTVEAC